MYVYILCKISTYFSAVDVASLFFKLLLSLVDEFSLRVSEFWHFCCSSIDLLYPNTVGCYLGQEALAYYIRIMVLTASLSLLHHISSALSPTALLCSLSLLPWGLLPSLWSKPPLLRILLRGQTFWWSPQGISFSLLLPSGDLHKLSLWLAVWQLHFVLQT